MLKRYKIYGGKFVPKQAHFIGTGDWENVTMIKSMLHMLHKDRCKIVIYVMEAMGAKKLFFTCQLNM